MMSDDVSNKTSVVKIKYCKDIPWEKSQKYVVVLFSTVTRNLKAFVTENKFKSVFLVSLEDKDANTATDDLLHEAKSNLLK